MNLIKKSQSANSSVFTRIKSFSKFRLSDGHLFLVLMIVRILFFVIFRLSGLTPEYQIGHYSDSETYLTTALNLLAGNGFRNAAGLPEIARMPAYPLLIAALHLLFRDAWLIALSVIQLALNALAVIALRRTLERLHIDIRAARIAVLIAAFNPHDPYFALCVLTDSFSQSCFMFVIASFVAALVSTDTDKYGESSGQTFPIDYRNLTIAAVWLTISIFLRPGSIGLPVCLWIGLTVVAIVRRSPRVIVSVLIIFTLVIGLPVLGWTMRNERVAGFSGFTAISTTNLFFYNCAGIRAELNGTDYYSEQSAMATDPVYLENLKTMTPIDAQRATAMPILLNNLPILAKLTVQNGLLILFYPGTFDILRFHPAVLSVIDQLRADIIANGFSAETIRILLRAPIGVLIVVNVIILAMITFYGLIGSIDVLRKFSLRSSLNVSLLALAGMTLYNFLIHTGSFGYGSYSRYRLSITFPLLILAAIGIQSSEKLSKSNKA